MKVHRRYKDGRVLCSTYYKNIEITKDNDKVTCKGCLKKLKQLKEGDTQK